MGFGSRQPNSNDPPKKYSTHWNYGPKEPHDNFSALLNDLAKACAGCKRITLNKYLNNEQKCPECAR